MKVVSIIPARMDSSRLPGKPLRLMNGQPLISHVIRRCLSIKGLSETIVATTTRVIDDRIADYAKELGVKVYRGSLENVTSRFCECAKIFDADYFVRVNGDSPFVDHALVEAGMSYLDVDKSIDLVTNIMLRTFPYGISVEIVSVDALSGLIDRGLSAYEQEHVTACIYGRSTEFNIKSITSVRPELALARLTVDTEVDLSLCEKISVRLGDDWLTGGFERVAELYLAESKFQER